MTGTPSAPKTAAAPVERWTTHGRTSLYSSPWVGLDLVSVQPPGRPRYEHHVVRLPSAVGVVLSDAQNRVLLIHRHRFITDTEGFEIPAGAIETGESHVDAARRELLEETGWSTATAEHFLTVNSSDGATDQRFHYVHATADTWTGSPEDAYESSSLHWVGIDEIPVLLQQGRIPGALTGVALLYMLQFGIL
ncbi:NUDIX hydrolase [Streptomyces naphthomycinicus]|uniref:NUDIX hydrolase n=1 Tax=Streptomyces naphthomycinicus TaxID=2872625 RepID=UPI001CED3093|nr:NUDIX hydrolase [Streptomyces sp. TML10]